MEQVVAQAGHTMGRRSVNIWGDSLRVATKAKATAGQATAEGVLLQLGTPAAHWRHFVQIIFIE